MSALVFVIKSGCCLALFLIFYKLVLEQERMHVFKRFYLLAALLLSLVIPSITFTEYVEAVPVSKKIDASQTRGVLESSGPGSGIPENSASLKGVLDGASSSAEVPSPTSAQTTPPQNKDSNIYWSQLLWSIYGIGAAVFALKFLRNLWGIGKKIRRNPKTKAGRIVKVLVSDPVVPHTFFNYIFLHRNSYELKKIPSEVILHEQTHARQIHSLDILLAELLKIVFWVNPLLHLSKTYIKLNHEFLADQAVIERGASTPGYQELLLAFASSANGHDNQSSLANAINYSSYSSIKKRFTIMKKSTTKKSKFWRSILLMPMLALLIYGFSNTVQIPKPSDSSIEVQEGATEKQIREYNALAKKYNEMLSEKGNIRIKKQEVSRLETLYGLMTESQRAEAETFPDFPEPPAPPSPPSPPNQNQREKERNIEQAAAEMERQKRLVTAQKEKIRSQKSWSEKQEEKMTAQAEKTRAQVGLSKKQQAQMKKQIEQTVKQVEKMADQEALNQLEQLDIETLMEDVQQRIEAVMNNNDIAAIKEEALQNIIENQEIYDELNNINPMRIQSISKDWHNDGQRSLKSQTYSKGAPAPHEPPAPQSPLSFLEELKDENALIILNGKEVGYDEAVKAARNNTFSNVNVKRKTGKRPVIKLKTQ